METLMLYNYFLSVTDIILIYYNQQYSVIYISFNRTICELIIYSSININAEE